MILFCMKPSDLQISPPNSWIVFESLCHALFTEIWNDPYAQKNGRVGQAQKGVDVWGFPERMYGDNPSGIQCKGKTANYSSVANFKEVREECKKADNFKPSLRHWIFATTSPRDAKLQEQVRKLSEDRKAKGLFTISVFAWDDIVDKLCEHPKVLKEFYPNQADHIPELVERVKELITEKDVTLAGTFWTEIKFMEARDFKSALLGKKLGANDALSCPRLTQADVLVRELTTSRTARLVGPPGAGKSVCAYQAAFTLSNEGYKVVRLLNPQIDTLPPFEQFKGTKTVVIIDDAHLMRTWLLEAIEQHSSDELTVLSTFNETGHEWRIGTYIAIDPKRAVKTIAKSLRDDFQKTLKIVAQVDSRVGARGMHEDLSQRLTFAEEKADSPWQFCFILGGGRQRAGTIADAARTEGLDIILAIISALQIAGRDAIVTPHQITSFAEKLGLDVVINQTSRLAEDRILISEVDCRTPHQRFASALLNRVLENQDEIGRKTIADALNRIVSNDKFPIIGIRNLFHELFYGGLGRWVRLFTAESRETIVDRCWKAETNEERNEAALMIDELRRGNDVSLHDAVAGHEALLANWIETSEHPSGYGLSGLLNSLGQNHVDLAKVVLNNTDPTTMANKINTANPDNAFTVARLIGRAASIGNKTWNEAVANGIDHKACVLNAKKWPLENELHSISELCSEIRWYDKRLPLKMAEAITDQVKHAYSLNPFKTQRHLHDIFWGILYLDNSLGIYPKPDKVQLKIGRNYLADIDPKLVSKHFADLTLRQMQNASTFLMILKKCSKAKYNATIRALDFEMLAVLFEDEWGDPSHEAEVLLSLLCATDESQNLVAQFFANNQDKLNLLPPRWIFISREVVLNHLDAGKKIRLAKFDHVDWRLGHYVIKLVAKERPQFLTSVVEQCQSTLVKSLSQRNASWFKNAYDFLFALYEYVPDFLNVIVNEINVTGAKDGWADSLRQGGKTAQAVAILIEVGLNLDGDVHILSEKLRRQFPKTSVLKKKKKNN